MTQFYKIGIFLLLMTVSLTAVAYGQIIMGSQPYVGDIDDEPREFYDPGGTGSFGMNLRDTMTLRTNMLHTVLYVLFEEFAMTEHDTLWIFNGGNTDAPLIGVYNLANSPGELVATGQSMTFVFHSDSEEIPGLTEGWKAIVYAYDTIPDNILFGDGQGVVYKCLAEFYDSGGPNGNIVSNNENQNGNAFVEFISPIGTHIKCVFDQFSVNGRMEIYDGEFHDINKRLIGQFCASTLDNSTQNRPPVLFSTGNVLTFVYVGNSNDMMKAGWHATITCVPELTESNDAYNPFPQLVNVPGGMYASVENPHVIEYDDNNPIVLLEAQLTNVLGRYTNDYTIKQIPYDEDAMLFGYDEGQYQIGQTDDMWMQAVPLGFIFNFFGKPYTTVSPGDNGIVSFSPQNQGTVCSWSIPIPAEYPPYASIPYNYSNSVYGVYEDINMNVSCPQSIGVYFGVMGQEPCRAFVFNFYHVGLFSCCSQGNSMYNTYQMVLYEGSNIIDVYVKHRNFCANWNGGRGVIGLQNSTSSQILTPSGRDCNSSWTAQNEAWRFTPISTPDESAELTWYVDTVDDAHIISYDNHAKNRIVTVIPTHTTMYISEYKYRNANNVLVILRDTTYVHYPTGCCFIVPDFSYEQILNSDDITVQFNDESLVYHVTPGTNPGNSPDTTYSNVDHIQWFVKNGDDYQLFALNNTNPTLSFEPEYIDEDGHAIVKIIVEASADVVNSSCIDSIEKIIPLSLESVSEHSRVSLMVYPNPAYDFVNVQYKLDDVTTEEGEILLVDAYGRRIRAVETSYASSPQQTRISISDLAAGVYFVKLMSEGKTLAIRKIVKK